MKNLLLTVASVLFTLVVMEAALWIIAPPVRNLLMPKGFLAYSPHGWILRPGTVSIMDNRRDYRNKTVTVDERGLRITPSGRRVVRPERYIHLLGDSQTFGQGLADAETWPDRLQERLLTDGWRDVKVENYGVPAINVDQYHARSKSVVPTMRPGDIMLVGLSWNDLMTPPPRGILARLVDGYLVTGRRKQDDSGRPRATPENRAANAPAGATAADRARLAIERRELAAIRWRLWLYEQTGIVIPYWRALKPFVLALSENSALASFLFPHLRWLYFQYRSDNNPFLRLIADRVPEHNFRVLNDIKRRVEARGGRFAVVFMQSRFFVEDALYTNMSQDGRAFPARNYQAYIARPLCVRFRITCFDPFEVLQHHNREGIYFPIDGHYNAQGARLIGDLVARSIVPLLKPAIR